MAEPQAHRFTALDHVNIRTAHVEGLVTFYCAVLGLSRGARPPFPFGGAWLYCGGSPVVHLVEDPRAPARAPRSDELLLSHFAFRATGMNGFIARLQQAGIAHEVGQLPGSRVVQINLRDPDGNALHVDFADGDDSAAG